MNKGELVSLIRQYLETDEETFVDNINTFIQLAEEEIYRRVQFPKLQKSATSLIAVGSKYLGLPDDFLSVYSLMYIYGGIATFLQSKDISFIREAFPTADQGLPRYYAQFDDDTLLLGPTPSVTVNLEMTYYYSPSSITEEENSGTTWLSENAQNALLFGSILQGYIYLKGDQDVIAQYKEKFENALADLMKIGEGRNKKDTYRTPDSKVPV